MDGIVYIAFGSEHIAEACEAAISTRAHMPGVPMVMLTDRPIDVQHAFDELLIVRTLEAADFGTLVGSANPAVPQRNFYNKILALEQTPFENTLFLDTDTRVCAPLRELFLALGSVEMAVALAPERTLFVPPDADWFLPAHNTGVLAYRRNSHLFAEWKRLFVTRYCEGDFSDQTVFDELLATTRTRISSLPEEFNYRVSAVAKLHGRAKVLHGRDHAKLEATERFVNSTESVRLVIPEVGMVWLEDGDYLFLSYDDQQSGPIRLRRQQLLLRLSQLL